MFPAYIVEYVRLGKEESFITKDQSRAEEYAAQHNGIITPLVKWLATDDSTPLFPLLSTQKTDACCQPAKTAM
jgi:hypothetical protein